MRTNRGRRRDKARLRPFCAGRGSGKARAHGLPAPPARGANPTKREGVSAPRACRGETPKFRKRREVVSVRKVPQKIQKAPRGVFRAARGGLTHKSRKRCEGFSAPRACRGETPKFRKRREGFSVRKLPPKSRKRREGFSAPPTRQGFNPQSRKRCEGLPAPPARGGSGRFSEKGARIGPPTPFRRPRPWVALGRWAGRGLGFRLPDPALPRPRRFACAPPPRRCPAR